MGPHLAVCCPCLQCYCVLYMYTVQNFQFVMQITRPLINIHKYTANWLRSVFGRLPSVPYGCEIELVITQVQLDCISIGGRSWSPLVHVAVHVHSVILEDRQ